MTRATDRVLEDQTEQATAERFVPFDAHGHNARHWTPPVGGVADRARRAMMVRVDRGDIEARTERSQSFWSAFRQARGMAQHKENLMTKRQKDPADAPATETTQGSPPDLPHAEGLEPAPGPPP
jgi:hypothetical protein